MTTNEGPGGAKSPGLLRKRLIPILVFVFVTAVAVILFCIYGRDPDLIVRLAAYGYLGAFLISLIGNA
ncbi:MAG: hypothetical protein IBX68_12240, partial [Dehalococcoidia bacterium]|nr:hypothetical protein [Dehalococcoidia bacterium]